MKKRYKMISVIAEKLDGYDPDRHTIAIYTPTARLASWLAHTIQLDRRKWFYVKNIHDLFGSRDLYLLFYGNFYERDDFDEVWKYWETFMPPDCHHYLLERDTNLGEEPDG